MCLMNGTFSLLITSAAGSLHDFLLLLFVAVKINPETFIFDLFF